MYVPFALVLPNLTFLYSATRHKDLGGPGADLTSEKQGKKYIVYLSRSYVLCFTRSACPFSRRMTFFPGSAFVAGVFIEDNLVLPILISFLCALTVVLYSSLEATSQYHLLYSSFLTFSFM